MKIGVLIDRINVGGVEKVALEQVLALRKIGVDAELLVLTRNSLVSDAFSELQEKVPIVYLDDFLPSFCKFTFKFPVFNFFSLFHITYAFLLPFFIKKYSYSYIICHGTFTCFSAIGIKYILKIPFSAFIWDPIGYILLKVYKNDFNPLVFNLLVHLAYFLDKFIINSADEILVGGKAHNNYFKNLSQSVRITVIPPSVHPPDTMPKQKRSGILLVTAWKQGKNPEYITTILQKLPNAHATLVGKWLDNAYKIKFANTLKKLKLDSNVKVIGAVSDAELSNYYSKASVFLQINDDRGFGMPALEAAAHGTPFIIPRGQGVCELFKDKIHGYFVTEKNTTEIVKRLDLLLSDSTRRNKMGRDCYDTVKKNYSWNVHALDLQQVINRHT